jgi:hypothetical protein
MKSSTLKLLFGAASALALMTGGAEAGAIAANPNPISFDAGFGKVVVDGQLSGLAYYQSNSIGSYYGSFPGNADSYLDIDNALISVAKTDGMFQFYVQAGAYSFPSLGLPYVKASAVDPAGLGFVPVAYGKVQLDDNFSIEAGKLPTLVGAELGFTTQNINIERGLLWNQEPLVSRGVQVNYADGPLSISLSWNDGLYSNIYNTGSGLISYAIDSSDTIAFDASITPDVGNRLFHHRRPGQQIYDLMYTYSSDPWTIAPYVQYQAFNDHPSYSCGGCKLSSGDEWGVGILGSYQFDPNWSLNGRFEYEAASGGSPNFWALIYGQKADAWSVTVTPTYQDGIFFARGELSYTGLSSYAHSGSTGYYGFGRNGTKDNQFRAMFETGVSL